nr:hypothetical protein [Marinicella sp. W31]MDC2876618.1 hypothetical protein [Marinicella sp. W31]
MDQHGAGKARAPDQPEASADETVENKPAAEKKVRARKSALVMDPAFNGSAFRGAHNDLASVRSAQSSCFVGSEEPMQARFLQNSENSPLQFM